MKVSLLDEPILDEKISDMCERSAQNTHPMHRHLESFQCFDLRSCAIGLYDSRPRPVPESGCDGLASRSSDGRRSAIRHLDRSVSNCCTSGSGRELKVQLRFVQDQQLRVQQADDLTCLYFLTFFFGFFQGVTIFLQSYGTQEIFHARSVDGISIGFRSHSGLGKLARRKSDREPFFSQV